MDEEPSGLADLLAEVRERANQLRTEGRTDEARDLERLADHWEPVARGQMFPYGAVNVLPSGPNWWN